MSSAPSTRKGRILVVDDQRNMRATTALLLRSEGYSVDEAGSGEEALAWLQDHQVDLLLTDLKMEPMDGLTLLKRAIDISPRLAVIVMTAYGSIETAVEAMRRGAYDYVTKPFKDGELIHRVDKGLEHQGLVSAVEVMAGEFKQRHGLSALVGGSQAMRDLTTRISRVASSEATVLVQGESGTGKELVARAIHALSSRSRAPFVPVNCAAITETLLESELFGHARGAFTDARTARRGLFTEADGGTIFLDEIGELPMAAQVKLLRVLQESEVRPVGESRAEKVDVRVVAATLRDLAKLVEKGEFREDLYFRLNVVPLKVPALRDRGDDVLVLARAFLERFNRAFNREPPLQDFTPEAEALLRSYTWPGNVRELENAVERAVLLTEGTHVAPTLLPEKLWATRQVHTSAGLELPSPASLQFSLKRAIETVEAQFIRAALRQTRGNRTRAAELLEISHRALLYKIKDYGIDPDAEGEKGPA